MISMIKYLVLIIIGFASGTVISGAVFAFIAIIGVVPRMAQKTKTVSSIKFYEEMLILGGIVGCVFSFFNFNLPIGNFLTAIYSLTSGIFFGVLAVSLAEVLNVLPILSRRLRIKGGLFFFILSIAIGKMIGSLLYFLVAGFYIE